MTQEFGDEQIRVELKRIVEDFQTTTLSKLSDVEREVMTAGGTSEPLVRDMREKLEASKAMLSQRTQQMMDFIDRR